MRTLVNQAAPSELGTRSKSSLDNCSDSTRVAKKGSELFDLDANECEQLATILQPRELLRRVPFTYKTALDAFNSASVSIFRPGSTHANFSKVRHATRTLVERGYSPEQVKSLMTLIALNVCPSYTTAPLAVSMGIAEALEILRVRSV